MCNQCEADVQAKGMCSKHYMQWYRSQSKKECSYEECERAVYSRELCESHYKSLLRQENPDYDTAQREADYQNKQLVSKEYKKAHDNVRKVKGSASNYNCVDCGGTARHWSLSNSIEHRLYGIESKQTFPYSLNIEDYESRCSKCHGLYDKV